MISITHLKALAEKATKGPWNLYQYFRTTGVVTDIEQHRQTRIASIKSRDDADYVAAANPSTILALIEELEEKTKALEFYASRESWKFISYVNDCKDVIEFSDVGVKSYTDTADFACGSGGRRAREVLTKWSRSDE